MIAGVRTDHEMTDREMIDEMIGIEKIDTGAVARETVVIEMTAQIVREKDTGLLLHIEKTKGGL